MAPRRRMLVFRLVLYVVLAGIVTVVLLARPQRGMPDLRLVRARTAAGGPLVLKLDDDGVLRSWDVWLRGRCADGTPDPMHWWPDDDGAPARFTRRGDTVDAVETGSSRYDDGTRTTVVLRLHADVTKERATGTFRYSKRSDVEGSCGAGPVAFAVRLGPGP